MLTQKQATQLIQQGQPGRYFDRDGLNLFIDKKGRGYWIWRSQKAGDRRERSLGPVARLSLREAREAAAIEAREAAPGGPTFEKLASDHFDVLRPSLKDAKADQWLSSLKNHAFPSIGQRQVGTITEKDIIACLLPIHTAKPETARRLKSRIRAVMAAARGRELTTRSIDWEAIAAALPKVKRAGRPHPAIPFMEVPAFYARIDDESRSGPDIRAALKFQILTAVRPGNVALAKAEQFDLEAATWTIPAEEMKAGTAHRVPLTDEAVKLVKSRVERGGFIFRGRDNLMMSNSALLMLMRRLKVEAVPHGFRSSFKDWSLETDYPDWLSEIALAHSSGDKVRAAYARTDAFQKRMAMMKAWSDFVTGAA